MVVIGKALLVGVIFIAILFGMILGIAGFIIITRLWMVKNVNAEKLKDFDEMAKDVYKDSKNEGD